MISGTMLTIDLCSFTMLMLDLCRSIFFYSYHRGSGNSDFIV